MNSVLDIISLEKSFKQNGKIKTKPALSNFSITIERGSVVGIVGSNGAGKSTLVNIISGLVDKDSGKIFILGKDFDKNKFFVKRRVGAVPQDIVIDPFFNITKNLQICAGYYGVKNPERKIDEILSNLGLYEKKFSMPRSLSGGMKKRFLIAKALLHDPDIIIFDEPTAGVDVALRIKIFQYIKSLKSKGKTIIITTHYAEEIEMLCDNVAIINCGNLVSFCKKDQLFDISAKKEIEVGVINPYSINALDKVENITYQKGVDERTYIIKFNINKIATNDVLSLIYENGIKLSFISMKKNDIDTVLKDFYLESSNKNSKYE